MEKYEEGMIDRHTVAYLQLSVQNSQIRDMEGFKQN